MASSRVLPPLFVEPNAFVVIPLGGQARRKREEGTKLQDVINFSGVDPWICVQSSDSSLTVEHLSVLLPCCYLCAASAAGCVAA